MRVASFVLAAALGLAATVAVYAHPDEGDQGPHAAHRMHGMEFSVEHAAMHNLVVAALSVKTGRSQDEIAEMFRKSAPPDVAKQLGLDADAMHGIMTSAHRSLVDRMRTANLITPEQADKLRDAPLPFRHHHDQPDRQGSDTQ